MNKCCIFGAGEYADNVRLPDGEKLIIACDGGYNKLKSIGIVPDIILGDFDSLGYVPAGENVFAYPVHKDYTDMEIAVEKGLSSGCREFFLYGSLGGEIDHTLSNVGLLVSVTKSGGVGYLIGSGNTVITAVHNGKITFSDEMRGRLSVFSIDGDAEDVTLSGFEYSLYKGRLRYLSSLGCGNSFIGEEASVNVGTGTLAVVFHSDTFPSGDDVINIGYPD